MPKGGKQYLHIHVYTVCGRICINHPYVDNYYVDNYYVDNYYVDNYYVDNYYVDNYYVDNYYVDNYYVDNYFFSMDHFSLPTAKIRQNVLLLQWDKVVVYYLRTSATCRCAFHERETRCFETVLYVCQHRYTVLKMDGNGKLVRAIGCHGFPGIFPAKHLLTVSLACSCLYVSGRLQWQQKRK